MDTLYTQSNEHDDRVMYAQKSPNLLTLPDLQIPDGPPLKKRRSGTTGRLISPPVSNSGVRENTVSPGMKTNVVV